MFLYNIPKVNSFQEKKKFRGNDEETCDLTREDHLEVWYVKHKEKEAQSLDKHHLWSLHSISASNLIFENNTLYTDCAEVMHRYMFQL